VFLGREVGLRERQSYSEQTAALIDEEVQELIAERYQYVQHLLAEHQKELERVAHALLKRESLDEHQLQQLVKGIQNNMELLSESKANSNSLVAASYSVNGKWFDHS
jgi:cell division protease FtsH